MVLAASVMFMISGCESKPKASTETYKHSAEKVYAEACVKCHGAHAEGNPEKKGPALNDSNIAELEMELYDVKNGGTNQSSGTEHEVMEHNMKKLFDKGYGYDVKEMAKYIHGKFHKGE
jgi:cytochrome c553